MLVSFNRRRSIIQPETFRLRGSCREILGCLEKMGTGTLVMRQHGLSLAKKTGFGNGDVSASDETFLDTVSGLELCLSESPEIYIMPCPDDGRPLLAIGLRGQPVDVSIHWDDLEWDSPRIQELIRRFDGEEMKRSESWRLAANAWLDEWPEADRAKDAGCRFRQEIIEAFQQCEVLEVEVKAGRHRCMVWFRPTFIDFEGPVLRIADPSRNHVIFLDVDSASFRIRRLSPLYLQIGKPVEAVIHPTFISHPAA